MVFDLLKLAEPFDRAKISWRAQVVSNGKALALAYIDARDVQDRLDVVCGRENWQNRYPHVDRKTVCEIGIRVGDEWIWKSDGAGDSDVEAEKGALSDAFKRAAVKWGIGRYLYDLDCPWVPCEIGQNGKFKKFTADPWSCMHGSSAAGPSQPIRAEMAWDRFHADGLRTLAAMTEIADRRQWWADNKATLGQMEGAAPLLFKSIKNFAASGTA